MDLKSELIEESLTTVRGFSLKELPLYYHQWQLKCVGECLANNTDIYRSAQLLCSSITARKVHAENLPYCPSHHKFVQILEDELDLMIHHIEAFPEFDTPYKFHNPTLVENALTLLKYEEFPEEFAMILPPGYSSNDFNQYRQTREPAFLRSWKRVMVVFDEVQRTVGGIEDSGIKLTEDHHLLPEDFVPIQVRVDSLAGHIERLEITSCRMDAYSTSDCIRMELE